MLNSFDNNLNVCVIGASGAIGAAFTKQFLTSDKVNKLYAFSRSDLEINHEKLIKNNIDIKTESSIQNASTQVKDALDIIIIATGFLHNNDNIQPEKSLRNLDIHGMQESYLINTIGPALIGKHFIPLLPRNKKSVFAAVSARVSSISDNRLGGWYSYRCAKSALNMFIKTASVEAARKFKQAAIIGLHPGTVDSKLSAPFKKNVAEGKLFTPEFSVSKLMNVIDMTGPEETGKLFAWDGQEIPY